MTRFTEWFRCECGTSGYVFEEEGGEQFAYLCYDNCSWCPSDVEARCPLPNFASVEWGTTETMPDDLKELVVWDDPPEKEAVCQ